MIVFLFMFPINSYENIGTQTWIGNIDGLLDFYSSKAP